MNTPSPKIKKFQLIKAIRDDFASRQKQVKKGTWMNYKSWYKDFRKFLFEYNARTITLTNSGIGKNYFEHLLSKDISNSSLKYRWDIFIAMLNRLELYHKLDTGKMLSGLTKKHKESEDWFLKDEEVKQLLNFDRSKIEKENINVLLDRFIIACFTGCRHSEVETIETVKSKSQLKYYSKKTNKYVVVPYLPIIAPFIESGRYKKKLSKFFGKSSNTNYCLRHYVFKELGWNDEITDTIPKGNEKDFIKLKRWEAVTFHDARKYYGKMLLDNDVSIYKVSQLMGHSSVLTTEKFYAAVTREKMMEEVSLAMNKF